MTPFSSYRLPSPLLALLAAAVSAARKETYLWFYWHDMMMAEAVVTNAASATSFCAIYAMHDPLSPVWMRARILALEENLSRMKN